MPDLDEEHIPKPPQEVVFETGGLSEKQFSLLGLAIFLAIAIGAGLGFYQMFAALPLRQ